MESYELNYCEMSRETNVTSLIQKQEDQILLYKLLCPPLIFACLVSVALNLGLIMIGRLGTHKKSPVLILSLNLASTDTMASLLNGIGFIFNSYLPVVFDVHFDTCPFLAMEIARCSALISSVLHLLALAFIHYKGIVRPLHYRVRAFFSHHVTRSIHFISTLCWSIPLLAFTVYFYSIPCQGFRSSRCDYHFLASKRYRIFILFFFLIPLVLMFFLYARIFMIIRKNQRMHLQSNGCVQDSTFPKNTILVKDSSSSPRHVLILRSCRKCWKRNSSGCFEPVDGKLEVSKKNTAAELEGTVLPPSSNPVSPTASSPTSEGLPAKSSNVGSLGINIKFNPRYVKDRRSQIGPTKSNTKALVTSLLILGTYLLCWLPAVTFLVLTCIDGCPFPLNTIPKKVLVITSSITNFLVILKAIVDPFIYIFRTKEVKIALRKIFKSNQGQDTRRNTRSTLSNSTNGSSVKNAARIMN